MKTEDLILVVDDNQDNLQLLSDMLDMEGYGVCLASSGLQALALAKTDSPALILLDIIMPGMDGVEVCRNLKKDPLLKNIPVIFLSGLDSTSQKVQAFREGAVDYITKPFQVEEVLARVHTHLQLARIEELERMVVERTAQLTEANHVLEAFSSSVAHDLKTPMNNVAGLCEILADKFSGRLGEEGAELVGFINASVQEFSSRIQALLAFSRSTRGELHCEPLDLSEMAGKIIADLRKGSPDRAVTVAIQGGLGAAADKNLVGEVLENLLGNAWKYTGKTGEARIEFGLEEVDGNRMFFVCDNGIGFNMKEAGNLFGMFRRLQSAADFPGDGIGLATVQRIILRHGGRIRAESEGVGRGSRFCFTLPEVNKS